MTTSTASVDPRIRARRVAVQRDQGRRRLRRLVALTGVVGLTAAAWGAIQSPLLDVDRIDVAGTGHTDPAAVTEAAGVERGAALATVDLDAVAERISALPWVQTVDVSRGWPSTLKVRIVERSPVAAVPAQDGGWVLVDPSGRQLTVVPEPPAEVVRLEVAPLRPEPGAELAPRAALVLRLATTVPDELRPVVVALRPGGAGAEATVRLPDGATAVVLLGPVEQARSAWAALATVLDDVDLARVATIDVRVPAAPALTRHP